MRKKIDVTTDGHKVRFIENMDMKIHIKYHMMFSWVDAQNDQNTYRGMFEFYMKYASEYNLLWQRS